MTTSIPNTPTEWLKYLSDLAAKYPLGTITEAGAEFQRCCIEFLDNAAAENADIMDLKADLVTILPRFLNVITVAEHNGVVSILSARRDAAALSAEIVRDMGEIGIERSKGSAH